MQKYETILDALKERFPQEQVKQREGPAKKVNGQWEKQMFNYVPTPYLQERLDKVLGLNWGWETLSDMVIKVVKSIKDYKTNEYKVKEVEQVVTKGRLTIHLGDGQVRYREAYGGCDLNYGSQSGDAFKIADSNAFKKACLKFGVAAYLATDGLEEDTHEPDAAISEATKTPFKKNFVKKPATQQGGSIFRIKR